MVYHTQIDPIYKKGSSEAAVLLLHGFTATPDIMRPLANHLNEKGWTVLAPLLAGHGATREKLARTSWKDWYQTTEKAFFELKSEFDTVCVAGLSLGGILTLKLVEDHHDEISAIACLATPLFLDNWVQWAVPMIMNTPVRYLYRYQKKMGLDLKDESVAEKIWHIKDMPVGCIHSLMKLQKIVRKDLEKISIPTLVVHAKDDTTAPYRNLSFISESISAPIVETLSLEESYHLITVDHEKDKVAQNVQSFFQRFL